MSKKIVYAEDNDSIRETAVAIIETWGYEVIGAEDGRVAYDVIINGGIDLIITDVVMPLIDGMTLCKLVRDNPGLKHIPVIMMTGLDKPVFAEKGMSKGADVYMTKPVDWDKLKNQIEQLLH